MDRAQEFVELDLAIARRLRLHLVQRQLHLLTRQQQPDLLAESADLALVKVSRAVRVESLEGLPHVRGELRAWACRGAGPSH